MKKTAAYIQKGEALNYVNNTQSKIPANTVLLFGNRMGIVGGDMEPGELGALHVVGVFEIPKKAGEALAAGDNVVFTEEDGIVKATDTVMGYAIEDAAASDLTAKVKLLG